MRGHVRKHRGKWQAIYDLGPDPKTGKRRQRSKTFPYTKDGKTQAGDWLSDRLHTARNLGIRTDPKMLTTGRFLELWLDALDNDDELRESTRRFYAGEIRRHILPALGAVRLRDLDVDHIREFYATLTPTKRDKVHSVLRPALADAVEDGKLAINPAVQASRRRRGKKGGAKKPRAWRAWNEAELNAFLAAVSSDRVFAMWRLYAMTGARRGELLALRWSDVGNGSIRIERAFVVAGTRPKLEGTKTGRERTVDVDDTTAAVLEAWRKAQIAERLAAGPAWSGGDWVFTTLDGSPFKPDWASRRFQELVRAADLPHIRLHDVRHTHASLSLKAGVPVHVVAERLGHSSPITTMTVYAHVIGSQQRDAAMLVDQMLTKAAAEANERG